MKKIFKNLFNILDDVLAYLLTLLGILLSNGITMMKNNEEIKLDFSLFKILISAAVAFIMVVKQEIVIPDEQGNTIKAKEGRRKRFLYRMSNALAQGFMWTQLSSLF